MFTGIVEELGEVVAVERPAATPAGCAVRGPLVVSDAAHGDSIAVNGVCLTVVEHDDGVHRRRDGRDPATAAASAPSARAHRSTSSARCAAGSRLGGHSCRATSTAPARIVDARARRPLGGRASRLPPALARYVVEKGSITVDGVSLTVVDGRRRLVHRQPDPHHARPDHAGPQGRRRPGQPRGRRDRQVRRAPARRPDAGRPAPRHPKRSTRHEHPRTALRRPADHRRPRHHLARDPRQRLRLRLRHRRHAPPGLGLAGRHRRQRRCCSPSSSASPSPNHARAAAARAGRPAGLLHRHQHLRLVALASRSASCRGGGADAPAITPALGHDAGADGCTSASGSAVWSSC